MLKFEKFSLILMNQISFFFLKKGGYELLDQVPNRFYQQEINSKRTVSNENNKLFIIYW